MDNKTVKISMASLSSSVRGKPPIISFNQQIAFLED
jgi:hypothetical protein